MSLSLLQTAKNAFAWAKKELPSDCELEIYASSGRSRSVVWGEGKCEDLSQSEGGGTGIRVILSSKADSGKQGYAFTTGFSKDSISKSARNAIDSARALPPDPFRKLPALPQRTNNVPKSITDPDGFRETVAQIKERLRAGETALLKGHPLLKSVLRAGFSEGEGTVSIINSKGIEDEFCGSHASMGVTCLAEKEGERQEGGFGLSRRYVKDLDWSRIFDEAAAKTEALLGGKPIPSGKIPVIFDPSVGCDFLSLVAGMVCADSVQKGKSPFKGKLGQSAASPLITIVDDGTLPGGLGTSPSDDEGVPTQRTPVISKGKLEHFLYDSYSAEKDKTASTGNASRAGFKSSPGSGTTNFFIEAGTTPREKLLQSTRGLYLYDVMGLHMADPVSGDFSVGVIGAWLENGEFKSGVRGVTLAGNLLELLAKVDAVGDDLLFFGSTGSPTFRVEELTVSGV